MPDEAMLYWTTRLVPGEADRLDTLFIRGHIATAEFVARAKAATRDVAETLTDAAAIACLTVADARHSYGRWLHLAPEAYDEYPVPALDDGGPPDVPDPESLRFESGVSAAAEHAIPITIAVVSYDDLPTLQ